MTVAARAQRRGRVREGAGEGGVHCESVGVCVLGREGRRAGSLMWLAGRVDSVFGTAKRAEAAMQGGSRRQEGACSCAGDCTAPVRRARGAPRTWAAQARRLQMSVPA